MFGRRLWWAVWASAAALLFPHAIGDATTVGELHDYCQAVVEKAESVPAAICASYVAGFLDGYDLGIADTAARAELGPDGLYSICIPKDTDLAQIIAVFVQWARRNPTGSEQSARTGLWRALLKAWPCE